jgi:hypothetical protein
MWNVRWLGLWCCRWSRYQCWFGISIGNRIYMLIFHTCLFFKVLKCFSSFNFGTICFFGSIFTFIGCKIFRLSTYSHSSTFKGITPFLQFSFQLWTSFCYLSSWRLLSHLLFNFVFFFSWTPTLNHHVSLFTFSQLYPRIYLPA